MIGIVCVLTMFSGDLRIVRVTGIRTSCEQARVLDGHGEAELLRASTVLSVWVEALCRGSALRRARCRGRARLAAGGRSRTRCQIEAIALAVAIRSG